ncbi:MAG: hypothetical protein PHU34_06390 [Candidatus Methanoperedens sp.]|nr:hypothetical protein [Candidatus Methanoperedens sp.]
MVQDDMVRAEFDRSVDMENNCDEFLDLKDCVNTARHEKERYDGLIEGVNIACKKRLRLELVRAREEEKNITDYWIKQKNLS